MLSQIVIGWLDHAKHCIITLQVAMHLNSLTQPATDRSSWSVGDLHWLCHCNKATHILTISRASLIRYAWRHVWLRGRRDIWRKLHLPGIRTMIFWVCTPSVKPPSLHHLHASGIRGDRAYYLISTTQCVTLCYWCPGRSSRLLLVNGHWSQIIEDTCDSSMTARQNIS